MKPFTYSLISLLLLILSSCSSNRSDSTPKPQSGEKEIIGSPTVANVSGVSASYDNQTRKYTLIAPAGTDVRALKLDIGISPKASISPNPAVTRDYSNPVQFTVVAENGSSQVFTIVVLVKTVVSMGKNCLVTRIEDIGAKEYIDFKYDAQGRVIKMDIYFSFSYGSTPFLSNLDFTYNANGNLSEAKFTATIDKEPVLIIYKPIYQNGKLIRLAMQKGGAEGATKLQVDGLNRIVRVEDNLCYTYNYTAIGAVSRIDRCNGAVSDNLEYSAEVRHFFVHQDPGFLSVFYTLFVEFDDTLMLHQFWGPYMPTKRIEYYYPGGAVYKRNTITYKTNTENFPTEMKMFYETRVNSDFPRSINYNYKIVYGNCQ